jgi:hypothetical protein
MDSVYLLYRGEFAAMRLSAYKAWLKPKKFYEFLISKLRGIA